MLVGCLQTKLQLRESACEAWSATLTLILRAMGRNKEQASPASWRWRDAAFVAAVSVLVSFVYFAVGGVALPSDKADSNGPVERDSEVGTSSSTGSKVEWEHIGRRACAIQYAPHFLSDAEVDHILRVIDESGGFV